MTSNCQKIYVLRLNCNKFYIGRSTNLHVRFIDHMENRGAQWVKLWKCQALIDVSKELSIFDEDHITKKYMFKYGIRNVRGGTYFNPCLTILQLETLRYEFDTATHRCFKCGLALHRNHRCAPSLCNLYRPQISMDFHHTQYKNYNIDRILPKCYYCTMYGHRMHNCPSINFESL